MRIRRPRLSRRGAEHLLDDPAAHDSALGTLLSAARGPARPDELSREDATAATFHRTAMVPSPGRTNRVDPVPPRSGRAATRAVVATGAVVALASGGFALAGPGNLPHIPGLPGQASDRATESSSAAQTPKPSEASSTSDTPGGGASETGGPGTGGVGTTKPSPSASGSSEPGPSETGTPGSPTPTPNLEGLCRAFQANDRSQGSSLESPAFAALVTAAGSVGAVADYCVDLIGEPKATDKPSGKPTAKPTDKPSGKPTDKATSKPTSKPTDRATPTGSPTSTPTQSTATPTSTPSTGRPSTAPGKPTDQPSPSDKGGGRNP